MSPTSATAVTYLERSNDTPCDRIKNFIDSIGDILSTVDNEHLKKFTQICSQRAYNFHNQDPMPSLADCMNTMIRDQNTLDPNSKYYHYYNAMILDFLQRSMTLINSEPINFRFFLLTSFMNCKGNIPIPIKLDL